LSVSLVVFPRTFVVILAGISHTTLSPFHTTFPHSRIN
jgi:hypothetical protein